MLQVIRDRAQGLFAWVIVILLVVTFALWGINEYFSGDSKVDVAEVNGEGISQDEFQRAYEQQRLRIQSLMGGSFDPALIDDKRIKRDVLNMLVEERVLIQAAEKAGYRVGDASLNAEIQQVESFQRDGKFDRELYNQFLRGQGMTAGDFETRLRRAMLIDQFRSGLMNTVVVTSRQVDDAFRLGGQQRDIGYMTLPVAAFLADVTVNDGDVAQYYEKNRDRFTLPEQVSIEYLELSADALGQKIPIDEQAVRKLYADQSAELMTEEQRRAGHILIQVDRSADDKTVAAAKAKAEKILAQVRAGQPFESLAKQYSDDPGSANAGGDLGYFGRGVMDKAFEQATFALSPGQVSDLVRSDFGFHIIKLIDVKKPHVQTFEEARPKLEQDYRRHKAEEQFFEQSELLTNAAYESPDSLAPAAKAIGLAVNVSGLFTRDGGDGIAADPKVRAAAFSDDVLRGNNSEPVELGQNRVVVLRIKEHKQAVTRPLQEVRGEIVAKLRVKAAQEKVKAAGEALLARLRKGEDAAALAREYHTSWKQAGYIKREEHTIDPLIVNAAFKLAKPAQNAKSFGGVALSSGDYALISVSAVSNADPKTMDAATRDALKQAALRFYGESEFKAFLDELREKAKIVTKAESL
ncbi:MAG: SurA N-terminal domain-containing protein [Pseudomonadota bacterium]